MNPAKLHTSLSVAMSVPPEIQPPLPIIVKLRRGPLARGEGCTLLQVEPVHKFSLLDAWAMVADLHTLASLTDDPAVDLIWPDLPVHAWLSDAVPLIRAPTVWEHGWTGKGVKIGVVDSGIDAQHPDFEGRLVEYTDFIGNGDAPSDPNGHGTHVAGIAAGSGAASGGRLKGVAPDAGLVVARVLDGSGGGRTSGVMAGIEWAIEQGAQVINLSLGGPPFPSDGTDALSLLCDAAWQQGVVVCVAAGNLGPSRQTIGSPGAARNVITVAATNGRASGDSVADFSSRGPTGDGRLKPDLCMPGVDVVAPRARGTVLGQPVDEHYTSLRGTSQATPMVSGAAALLLQANPRLKPDDIKQRMVQGAVRLAGLEAVVQGAGRGDAFNALVGEAGVPEGTPELPQPIVPQPPRPEQQVGCLAAPVALLARRADK